MRHYDAWPSTGNLIFGETLAHNGNFYYAQYVPCSSNASLSCIQWTVIPPGSSTPLRTFNETVVPQANQSNVYWDYSTVGPDGTPLTRIDTLGGNAALYDGGVSTDAHARTPQSIGSGMAVGGNGGIHRR